MSRRTAVSGAFPSRFSDTTRRLHYSYSLLGRLVETVIGWLCLQSQVILLATQKDGVCADFR